jgi:hypothetical protein
MTKDELVASIRRDRATLDALVARIDAPRRTEPVLDGGWSVKDALAHVTAWEQRCLGWIRDGGADKPPLFTDEAINAYNAGVYEANRDRPLDDVLAESKRSFEQMVTTVEALPADEIAAPPAWAAAITLERIIDANSAEHYREHIEQLRRWLDET